VSAVFAGLLIAGLTGSVHCAGMCGPILLAFATTFRAEQPRSVALDMIAYHCGRLWTYALLGFAAGWLGQGIRHGGHWLGWQRPVALVLAAAVVLSGLVLAGLMPGARIEALLDGCGLKRMRDWSWFAALMRTPGFIPRMLLGAVMGLLPCGLVYAMLVAVAALPTPVHAAAGMLVFGLGTLPALSLVFGMSRVAPQWVRRQGHRFAAALLIVAGCVMIWRAAMSHSM
jgi:sulfite exporter TauE/SafE